MTHISEIIENILVEWAYRFHDGMPNPKNVQHIHELRKSMEEMNLPNNVIYQVIQNLINEEENPILKKTIKYKTDDGENKEGTVGGILKKGENHPAYKQAKAMFDKDKPEPETKPEEPKIPKTPIKTDKDNEKEKIFTKSTDMFKGIEPGKLKQTGDYEIKNLGLEYGYSTVEGVFKPAPGNAGSMLNEIISGEVTNILQENPNLSEEELMDTLMNQFGETKLFKQNKGSQRAGGIKKSEIPEGKNPGQYSKLLIAEVIGPNGKPVPMEEAIELINSGGGGDNPSDTATLVFDSKSNKVIMLFHSEKIAGSTDPLTVSTERAANTLVYVDSTQGWLLKNN